MRTFLIITALLGIMLQAGCAALSTEESTPPFGSSVRMAVRSQTAYPDAGSDEPVIGLDGRYAQKVAERYIAGPKEKDSKSGGGNVSLVEGK